MGLYDCGLVLYVLCSGGDVELDIDTLQYYLEVIFFDHLRFSRFYHEKLAILYLVGETSLASIRWIFGILFSYVRCRLSRGNRSGELLRIWKV